jgi:phosphoglycerol transferase MdoB-like AlkP superfamily enzyme
MWLLLFAKDQGLWFDFVDKWGNSASVLGFFLALIAFPVTWIMQWRIKHASQAALRKVAFVVLSMEVENLHRQLSTAREAGRTAIWLRAFDYCKDSRWRSLRLVGNPHLTEEEKSAIRAAADDLGQVIQYIEANKLGPNPSPVFQQNKKDMIDRIITLLTNIQGRLGTKTWEI